MLFRWSLEYELGKGYLMVKALPLTLSTQRHTYIHACMHAYIHTYLRSTYVRIQLKNEGRSTDLDQGILDPTLHTYPSSSKLTISLGSDFRIQLNAP